jgi:hypothetical protein
MGLKDHLISMMMKLTRYLYHSSTNIFLQYKLQKLLEEIMGIETFLNQVSRVPTYIMKGKM